MDEEMLVGLDDEIIADLSAELEITDEMYKTYSSIIPIKVRNAIREVMLLRKYPQNYSQNEIEKDLYNYYPQIRAIALYDYNSIGREGQTRHSESGISETMVQRETLFNGINPLADIPE